MEKFEITISRIQARALLDYLMKEDEALFGENLTDILDEAQGAAQDSASQLIITIRQGDL